MEPHLGLNRVLRGWQIFMITVSGVIGTGILHGDTSALEIAGPGGVLFALMVVALVATCTMECISEMVQLFPVPNALMSYVACFVDRDLAWLVGIAYWYTYAAFFGMQLIGAASEAKWWQPSSVWTTLGFFVIAPIVLLGINFVGVNLFGWIETVGGIIKIGMLVGISIFLYVVNAKGNMGSEYIADGFQNHPGYAANKAIAAIFVVPLLLYSFVGVEIVAVTASESVDARTLRWPSRIIAYFITVLYVFCVIGELLDIRWSNWNLAWIYGSNGRAHWNPDAPPTRGLVTLAALEAGYPKATGVIAGCLIYCALSAANTSLYVASRTLYGVYHSVEHQRIPYLKLLGRVWHRNKVPMFAMLVSALAFIWLPLIHLRRGYTIVSIVEIMNISASTGCLFVWGAQCLAYIRYYSWLKLHKDELRGEHEHLFRWSEKSGVSTILAGLQPLPAWIGLIGCLTITLIFTSATWWSSPPSFRKVASAYGAYVILMVIFCVLKAYHWWNGSEGHGLVDLRDNFCNIIHELDYKRLHCSTSNVDEAIVLDNIKTSEINSSGSNQVDHVG